MKTKHLRIGILANCFFVFGLSAAMAQGPATGNDEAWRHDMSAFGQEVISVAGQASVPDEFQLLESVRSRQKFVDKDRQTIRVLLQDAFTNELHGLIAKRFTGSVDWKGIVDSAEINEQNKMHHIEIKFPVPTNAPGYLVFRETVLLRIPFEALSRDKAPTIGADFAFTGTLKKKNSNDLYEPVFVIYGVGAASGKHLVGVTLNVVIPQANQESKSAETKNVATQAKLISPSLNVSSTSAFPIVIAWKQTNNSAIRLTDALQIAYQKVGATAPNEALLVTRYPRKDDSGKVELFTLTDYRPKWVKNKPGDLDLQGWAFFTSLGMSSFYGGTSGTGTIHVALFEVQPETDAKKNSKVKAGAQLSNWIDLLISVP